MDGRDLLSRLRQRLTSADRPRSFALALAVVVAVAATAWFFTAEDERGKTARLHADAPYYHVYLPSLVVDRDLDFSNQYAVTRNWYRFAATERGRPGNVFGIGPALFELPFFAVGRDLTRLAGDQPDGFSTAEVKATMLASLWFSLGALFFAYRLLRRRFGSGYLPALIPVLVACGGPVVYYAIRQPGYAHPFASFWIAWFVDAWDASFDRERPRRLATWLGLGALLGLAALARPQTALWGILLGWAVIDDLRARERGQRLMTAVRVLVPRWAAAAGLAALILVPQLLAWKSLYGSFFLVPQGDGFMRWDAPAWSETLFSSRNGLLPWAPLYAVAGLGLVIALARVPRLAVAMIVGVMLQSVVNGAVWDWWAGGSFGGRRFDSCYIAFAVGLGAMTLAPWRRAALLPAAVAVHGGRLLVVVVASLLAVGNLVLASSYSGTTVRIYGGQAAHKVIDAQVGGMLGGFLSAASRLANWPVRVAFAARYDTSREAYDYAVGHHLLGERFPGLNSTAGRTSDRITLVRTPRKLVGMREGAARGTVELRGERGAVLVGLNRFGPVTFKLRAQATRAGDAGELTMSLNGSEIARADLSSKPAYVVGVADTVTRGVNELTIEAPAGTVLYWLDLDARANPRGTRR